MTRSSVQFWRKAIETIFLGWSSPGNGRQERLSFCFCHHREPFLYRASRPLGKMFFYFRLAPKSFALFCSHQDPDFKGGLGQVSTLHQYQVCAEQLLFTCLNLTADGPSHGNSRDWFGWNYIKFSNGYASSSPLVCIALVPRGFVCTCNNNVQDSTT